MEKATKGFFSVGPWDSEKLINIVLLVKSWRLCFRCEVNLIQLWVVIYEVMLVVPWSTFSETTG